MAKKRKDHPNTSSSGPYFKRPRPTYPNDENSNPNSPIAPQPRLDPTYGQRGAFPGLDDKDGDGEEGLFYGPADNGLEYLRMVRSEAKGVPNLLVAPRAPETDAQEDLYADYDEGGWYADGAYTATPSGWNGYQARSRDSCATGLGEGDDEGDEDMDPQEAYYAALCTRYSKLKSALQAPFRTLAPSATPLHSVNHSIWSYNLLYKTPLVPTLASLSQDDVMHGLEILEQTLTATTLAKQGKGKNLGAWVWALLLRCRDVGEMGSEEVSVLRGLGKRAVGVLRKLRAGIVEREKEEGSEEHDEQESTQETRNTRNSDSLAHSGIPTTDTPFEAENVVDPTTNEAPKREPRTNETEIEYCTIFNASLENGFPRREVISVQGDRAALLEECTQGIKQMEKEDDGEDAERKRIKKQTEELNMHLDGLGKAASNSQDRKEELSDCNWSEVLPPLESPNILANSQQPLDPPDHIEPSALAIPLEDDRSIEEADAISLARQRLLSSLPPPSYPNTDNTTTTINSEECSQTKANDDEDLLQRSDLQIYATLDTIITIVGEIYGQRDLLPGRWSWD